MKTKTPTNITIATIIKNSTTDTNRTGNNNTAMNAMEARINGSKISPIRNLIALFIFSLEEFLLFFLPAV